jgi:hypothetical protein
VALALQGELVPLATPCLDHFAAVVVSLVDVALSKDTDGRVLLGSLATEEARLLRSKPVAHRALRDFHALCGPDLARVLGHPLGERLDETPRVWLEAVVQSRESFHEQALDAL